MNWSRLLLAAFFTIGGIGHFVSPDSYMAIMPSAIPWPRTMVALSGVAEILGGAGIIAPVSRRLAGWGLIALLIAVFPANIQAISTGMSVAGHPIPNWALWARLPLQPLLIFWVYSVCVAQRSRPTPGRGQ